MKIGSLILLCIGVVHLTFSQSETHDLIKKINESGHPKTKIEALNKLAFIKRVSDPDSTLLLTEQSEKLALENGYIEEAADATMTRAIAYSIKGDYYLSLQMYLKSKTTYEELELHNNLAMCLSNIGTLYNMMHDDEKALAYYKASADACVLLGDVKMEGIALNNIGYILKQNGKYDESLKHLRRSLFIADESGNPARIAYPSYNIGSVYVKLEQHDSASWYLQRAIKIAEEINDQYVLSIAKIDLGLMNVALNKLEEAEKYLFEAYLLSGNAGILAEKGNSAGHLSNVYERLEMPEKALNYYKIHRAVEDSLFSQDMTKKTAFAEAEHKYHQQRIINEAEKDKILSRARWTRNTLFTSMIAMFFIVLWLFRSSIKRKKSNNELKALNQKIEKQANQLKLANEEITIMNNNLETVIDQRTKELKEKNRKLKEYLSSHSHVVRAPLARIIGLVQVYDPADHQTLDLIKDHLHESAMELDDSLKEINQKLADEQF